MEGTVRRVKCSKEVKTDGNGEATAIWWGWGDLRGVRLQEDLREHWIAEGERQTVCSR